MPQTAVASAPATTNSSKTSTPTGRSSGTGSNSSTNTPSSKKKKGGGGGDQNDGGSGGIAGLFASLCGGSKAKRAFDDRGATAKTTSAGAKPSTMGRQPSSSKALPAAPVTTRQVASDVEVTTTRRLSTLDPAGSSRRDGINSPIGDSNQNISVAENSAKEEVGVAINGDQPASEAPTMSAAQHTDEQSSPHHPSNGHVGNGSLSAKNLAPVVLGGTAVATGVAINASMSDEVSNSVPTASGNSREVQEQDQAEGPVPEKLDELVVPSDSHMSPGHPLPLDEVSPFRCESLSPYLPALLRSADGGHDISCRPTARIWSNIRACVRTPRSSPPSHATCDTFAHTSFQYFLATAFTVRNQPSA